MKIYWSYTTFPELRGFNPKQRKMIWENFIRWSVDSPQAKCFEVVIPLAIIISLVLGMVLGALCCRSPELGGFMGGLIGSIAPGPFIYLIGIISHRRGLKA